MTERLQIERREPAGLDGRIFGVNIALTDDQDAVVELIARLFNESGEWPAYAQVDKLLERE